MAAGQLLMRGGLFAMTASVTALVTASVIASVLALVSTAGCYAPNPASGTLLCSTATKSCPEGYTCADGRTCWKNGDSPDGGGGGDGGTLGRFIGTWTFVSPSNRVRVCTDGTNETMPWSDFFDVTTGGAAALATFYYCDWNLDVNAAGTATVIRSGAGCSAPDPNDSTISYTWSGQTFTLTTTNGRNATLDASLPYTYTTSAGSGSCTMHFTGTLTKN